MIITSIITGLAENTGNQPKIFPLILNVPILLSMGRMLPQTEELLLEDVFYSMPGMVESAANSSFGIISSAFPGILKILKKIQNSENIPDRFVHGSAKGFPKIMDQTACREVIILVFLPILIVIIT